MNIKILLSLLVIYVVWGSTFMAIKIGLTSFPPIMLAGMRFLIAGSLFAILSKGMIFKKLNSKNLVDELTIGLLMTVGNAGVCWGQQYISSSVAALVTGVVPLIFVTFNWLRFEKKTPDLQTIAGIVIGIAGITLITQDKNSGGNLYGVLFVLGANALWVVGSLKSRMSQNEMGFFSRSTVQMLGGGAFLVILSSLVGERPVNWESLGQNGLVSVLYLAVIGTTLAYTCYMYLLKKVRTEIVSTYALVNPVLAVLLGAMFLNEAISIKIILSTVLIILSVFIVTYGSKLIAFISEDKAFQSLDQ